LRLPFLEGIYGQLKISETRGVGYVFKGEQNVIPGEKKTVCIRIMLPAALFINHNTTRHHNPDLKHHRRESLNPYQFVSV
jgi:hypothetical protein